ncbi:cytochrome c [bacterium]|nr:cytochrome c [bacterium]
MKSKHSKIVQNIFPKRRIKMLFIALTLIIVAMTLVGGSSIIFLTPTVIDTFSSYESKTASGDEVFNKIEFQPGWSQDIWIMQQSHNGIESKTDTWDRIAIVVDKSQKPYVSKFYQFKPGKMEFGSENEISELRAPCFSCHVSGPRAIRPASGSVKNLWQKILVLALNFRIKSYGSSNVVPGHQPKGEKSFSMDGDFAQEPMELESCVTCHKTGGIRGPLRVEHIYTGRFLVKKGLMPPWPFPITNADKDQILGNK